MTIASLASLSGRRVTRLISPSSEVTQSNTIAKWPFICHAARHKRHSYVSGTVGTLVLIGFWTASGCPNAPKPPPPSPHSHYACPVLALAGIPIILFCVRVYEKL